MLYTDIINKNKDFLYLYRKGTSIVSKHAVIYARKNGKPYNRLGITAGKKVGNAVHRNRAKRVIRQAYAQTEKDMPLGVDIVIVARASIRGIKSTDFTEYLEKQGVKKIKAAAFGDKEK
ncbi:MAG: ribonuclease P protein component [Porcipelethomonas sp.]